MKKPLILNEIRYDIYEEHIAFATKDELTKALSCSKDHLYKYNIIQNIGHVFVTKEELRLRLISLKRHRKKLTKSINIIRYILNEPEKRIAEELVIK